MLCPASPCSCSVALPSCRLRETAPRRRASLRGQEPGVRREPGAPRQRAPGPAEHPPELRDAVLRQARPALRRLRGEGTSCGAARDPAGPAPPPRPPAPLRTRPCGGRAPSSPAQTSSASVTLRGAAAQAGLEPPRPGPARSPARRGAHQTVPAEPGPAAGQQ